MFRLAIPSNGPFFSKRFSAVWMGDGLDSSGTAIDDVASVADVANAAIDGDVASVATVGELWRPIVAAK